MRKLLRSLTRATPFTAALAFTAVLTGCGLMRPFIGSADAIDERSAQEAARIRLSPPQVFTREQLINDRMRENGFLVAQLERAASAPLGNSLSRDLQIITALAAQLSISVDPVAKLNFQRANDQAELQQQVNTAQLKTQLLVLQAQVAQISAANAAAEAASAAASAVSAGAASGPLGSTTVPFSASTAASDARLTALSGRIDEALKALATLAIATPRDNVVKGTFEDEFEDRFNARAGIRDRINAILLDDAHDADGNSLYHLQFKATVTPGANKAQYGVASMTFEKVDMAQEDFDLLYHTWLAAITNRMNQNLARPGGDGKEPLNYAVLGPLTGLYDVARFQLTEGKPDDVLQLAVHPGMRRKFEVPPELDKRYALRAITANLVSDDKASKACLERLLGPDYGNSSACDNYLSTQPSVEWLQEVRQSEALLAQAKLNEIAPYRIESPEALVQHARNVLEVAPSIEVAVHALGDRSVVADAAKKKGKLELEKFREAFEASRWLYGRLYQACLPAVRSKFESDAKKPPLSTATEQERNKQLEKAIASCERFDSKAIATKAGNAPGIFRQALEKQTADLRASPYSADPMMRVQRVSTVASVANALELAAGLSAQMPGSGANVGAGVGFSRRAAGRIDAIERVPEVIGFAGRSADNQRYEFGWLFGPRLVADADSNKAELRQQTRTVPVSADVSVPGWWTRATLKVNVAWRGKFSGGGSMIATTQDAASDSYTLPVRFRLNRASYDALTVTLMRALTSQGYHQARIDNVRPEVLPICKDATNTKVTLLIYGVDLWRNPRVFLGGTAVPESGITVLPDMTGLSATVDVGTLSKPALRADDTLVVWTNHGVAEAKLRTQVSANCEGAAGQPGVASETTLAITIERVSPSQISVCDDRVTLAVSGRGLLDNGDLYRLGTRPASLARYIEGNGSVRTVAVTFDGLVKANVGLGKLSLSVVGRDGLVNVPVDVAQAKCEPPPAKTYAFETDVERIVTTETTGVLRVRLTLPTGKKPAVSVKIRGGEIEEAKAEPDPKRPKTLAATLQGGVLTLASTVDLKATDKEKPAPVTISLKLRNLRAGDSVVLTATPPKGDTTGDIPLTIPVVPATPVVVAAPAAR